jgi:hypothetical protein
MLRLTIDDYKEFLTKIIKSCKDINSDQNNYLIPKKLIKDIKYQIELVPYEELLKDEDEDEDNNSFFNTDFVL